MATGAAPPGLARRRRPPPPYTPAGPSGPPPDQMPGYDQRYASEVSFDHRQHLPQHVQLQQAT